MAAPKNRNVFLLGMVSLFTDLSSQMIYPLLPQFLVSLGATSTLIGIIEGIAESVAALFRTIFGKLSDRLGKRKLFVYLGYGLSAISKPFLFLANSWVLVLGIRFLDRMGKAVRTPARDALISTSVDPAHRGKAFGWHRAMDRIGALGGPLLALGVLAIFEGDLRWVFLLAGIPALVSLIFIPKVKEALFLQTEETGNSTQNPLKVPEFTLFLVSAIVFTLGNSSNAFLILKASQTGIGITLIPLLWMVYNLLSSISSPVFGTLSDRLGKKPIIMLSFLMYSLIYAGFAMSLESWQIWGLFALYGLYYGLSEGVFRAYIADLVPESSRATAYGIFNTGIGLALFPASLITGILWDNYNSSLAFLVSAGFSVLGLLIFMGLAIRQKVRRPV